MRILAALLLASIASADPVHTQEDLVEELRPLAWLLGNWKAEGDLAGMKYREDIRYWPDLDGQVLIERAFLSDADKNVLHEDRIVFWADRDGIHAFMLERPPVHGSKLELKKTDSGFDLVPGKGGGPSVAFTKKADDAYDYVYEAKGEKGNVVRATGAAKRTKDDYADVRCAASEALSPVALGVGRCAGSNDDTAQPVKESQDGRAILGGEVFEVRIVQKRKDGRVRLRLFAWPAPGGNGWTGRLFTNTDLNGTELSGSAADGVLLLAIPTGKPSAGTSFRWKWQIDSYEWRMESLVDPRTAHKFSGTRAPW